ncbi:hypothetical protein FKW77_010535 [Venturia effusa]|uniref:Uncharacterized protein n=1 Tax=Venturia effusa TaxID=50376 RepID=A0A517L0J6_9PEZI|nr:hypothetical protein FKW77_010535 [Venturia effusa]
MRARASNLMLALALGAAPTIASLCTLGLPDPLGLCPPTTDPETSPVVVATITPPKATPTPPIAQLPTIATSPTRDALPPAEPTTAPIAAPTTESTRPAAVPTEPTVFLSTAAGTSDKSPSTTLTVPVPTRDPTTTLLSIVVSPSSSSSASVAAAVSSGMSGNAASSSRPAQVTANAAGVRGVHLVLMLGGWGVAGLMV